MRDRGGLRLKFFDVGAGPRAGFAPRQPARRQVGGGLLPRLVELRLCGLARGAGRADRAAVAIPQGEGKGNSHAGGVGLVGWIALELGAHREVRDGDTFLELKIGVRFRHTRFGCGYIRSRPQWHFLGRSDDRQP